MIIERKRVIQEGDYVILYEAYNCSNFKQVSKGTTFTNRNGLYFLDQLIGKPYGTLLYPKQGNISLAALHPTSELWTRTLPTRTAILYHPDISMIMMGCNIKPGSVVVESGTGSGSLSTAFARAVAPHGYLHTFEYNADRVKRAREEFKTNKINHLITCHHRDTVNTGFPEIEGGVDAVFLDLPQPWGLVTESAKKILRPSGIICTFSPCIEQVQRTCLSLDELGFTNIKVIECLLRSYGYRNVDIQIPDFGTVPSSSSSATASSSSSSSSSGSTTPAAISESKETQNDTESTTASSATAATPATEATAPVTGVKRSREEEEEKEHDIEHKKEGNSDINSGNNENPAIGEGGNKKMKTDNGDLKEKNAEATTQKKEEQQNQCFRTNFKPLVLTGRADYAHPHRSERGHTGYLCFATRQ